VSAGAPLSPLTARAFYDRFGVKIHSFYGTSETGGISYDANDDSEDAQTLGHPLPGVSVTMRAADGLPDGVGQMHVRSPAVAEGYVGDATDAFMDGGFLTSDYGRIETDGRLTLLGRLSSFINVAGRKVHPDEVEAILREMPAILDVRVIGVADARRGQHVVACLVARPGWAVPSPADIRRFCSSKLAVHKIPRTTFFVDAIPMTTRGKTDRARLDDIVRQHMAKVPPGGMV
jgi:long-chain acyl-CoA synthetase